LAPWVKKTKYYKLLLCMYGLFLGWLLSFIYSGPLFRIVIDEQHYSYSLLFSLLFLVPAAVFFILGHLNLNEDKKNKLLPLSVFVCLFCSIIYLLTGQMQSSPLLLIILIAATLLIGIFTMFFIISSTAYFVKIVPFNDMFKAMAVIILIANLIVYLVEILTQKGYYTLGIIVNFVSICFAFVFTLMIRDHEEIQRPAYDIPMSKKSLFVICASFFLLNIGGGVVFSVVEPAAIQQSPISTHLYMLPYIFSVIAMLTINQRVQKSLDILLTVAAGLVAIGLLLFQFSHINALITNMFIQIGYAMLDILLWGLVGKMCFVYGKPYKITSFTMASNITAVFLGMVGARILIDQITNLVLTLFAAVCIITAIMAMPFIHRITINDMEKGIRNIRREQKKMEDLIKINKIERLTTREHEIVQMMLTMDTNREIANALFISENTLKTHAKKIYSKLGVKNKKALRDLLRFN